MAEIKFFVLKVKALIELLFFIVSKHRSLIRSEIIFFFPYYHIGGAEKVHVDILKSVKSNKTFIFFVNNSESDANKQGFIKHSDYYEINNFLNRSKYIRKFFSYYLIKICNSNKRLKTLFASNSFYFYSILDKINKSITKIDLTHAFSYPDIGGEITSLPYVKYLDYRIVINKKTYIDFKNLYLKNNLLDYHNRIKIIPNAISFKLKKNENRELKTINVGYIGRWSKEKKPDLFLNIANSFSENNKYKFFMAGSKDPKHKKKCIANNTKLLGEIVNNDDLVEFYKSLHILLVTSYREGFPVVIMEAMSFGVVPISSDVGGISEHLKNNFNGFLININDSNKNIVSKYIKAIESLKFNSNYAKLSNNAFEYANKNFNMNAFKIAYNKLLTKT